MASPADTLVLGTAQLGQPYGIANRTGEPDEATADAVLELAWRLGIRYVDTAQAYGRAEEIIGRCVHGGSAAGAAGFRVVTKLAPELGGASAAELETSLEGSWVRLGGQPIWAMLLHAEALLDGWEGRLGDTLREWRDQGRITHLGVSIASEEGMRRAIELRDMEIIQAPANAFDRRMHRTGLFARAEAAGKKVFVRSVFLQGLMLLEPRDAARRLPPAAAAVARLDAFCVEHMTDRRRFAVGYARHHAPNALLVIGSETPAQVADNCRLLSEAPLDPRLYEEWDEVWPSDDQLLVDPSRWPKVEAR
jgi:aryl-alcohol dehydrogenase-like predicted oxidoreductase